jgi:hypothetical protein
MSVYLEAMRSTLALLVALAILAGCGSATRTVTRHAGPLPSSPVPAADPNHGPVFCDHHGVCSQGPYDPKKPWVGSNCGQDKRWPFYRGICPEGRHTVAKPWIDSNCGRGRTWRFFREIAVGIQYTCIRPYKIGY